MITRGIVVVTGIPYSTQEKIEKRMRKIVVLFVVAFCLLSTGMRAQHTFVHKQSSTYEWPEDSLV